MANDIQKLYNLPDISFVSDVAPDFDTVLQRLVSDYEARYEEETGKKVVLRPLMVVAGDHANNDMAGSEEDSWKSMFEAEGSFESVDAQIAGLGGIDAVKQIYVDHTKAVMDTAE